jgi:hypothetical protein
MRRVYGMWCVRYHLAVLDASEGNGASGIIGQYAGKAGSDATFLLLLVIFYAGE